MHTFYDLNLVSELCNQEIILKRGSSINIRYSQDIQSGLKQIIDFFNILLYALFTDELIELTTENIFT